MRAEVVPALPEHIATIADRMRPADVAEVAAASGRSPHQSLEFSLAKSSLVWTGMIDGQPELMFGVADLNVLTQVGAPWLLGTDAVEREYRLFLRQSRNWPEQLLQRYELLRNFVDDRNAVSKRWLEWLGFTLLDPMPVGINGEMFRLFEMRR
ncbi:MAG TPA: hypothetical protein VIG24_16625 [Acidimicrobiia bacterium]